MEDVEAELNAMTPIELVQLFLLTKISDKVEHNLPEVYSAFSRIVQLKFLDIFRLRKSMRHPVSTECCGQKGIQP